MLYAIQKDELLKILETFPDQLAFLKAVGRQRMQTTDPQDLIEDKDNNFQYLVEQNSLLNEAEDDEALIYKKVSNFNHNDSIVLMQSEYKRAQRQKYP